MPRRTLKDAGGIVFHVLNRSVRRSRLFFEPPDYVEFETALAVALLKFDIRLLAYCVMPNHWHLVVWPQGDELPRFMHWLTMIHARQWHERRGTQGQGHVYQARYRAIPVQGDRHFLTLVRYVERNPLRAELVHRAEDWEWSSAWRGRDSCHRVRLSQWPVLRPDDWLDRVNEPQTGSELQLVQHAIGRDRPLGEQSWSVAVATKIGLRTRGPGSIKVRVGH